MGIPEEELKDIVAQAKAEIAEERRCAAVKAMKIKLTSRKWWHKVFPFKFSITRITHD